MAGERALRILLLGALLASPVPALAADAPEEPDTTGEGAIIVLATGSATPADSTGQAVTVIAEDEIEAAQGLDLTRALERVPGLSWTRNGGPGSFTGVRLRGADAEQVLVLVDGVREEDVSAPSGGFDFGTLSAGEIGRIEVLRGSNSVPWGSAALGGVIALTSRTVEGVQGELEGGSHGTLRAALATGVEGEGGRLSASAGYARTDGVSAAAAGTEPDGFRNWRVGGRGMLHLSPGLQLRAGARLSDTRTQIDGFAPPAYAFGDTGEVQATRQGSGRIALEYSGATIDLSSGVALASTRRSYFDSADAQLATYAYRGRSLRWEGKGRVQGPAGLQLDFGGDSEWTRYSGTYDPQATARIASGHVLVGWEGRSGAFRAGLRRDDHSRFGGTWTAGANGTYRLAPGLRLLASFGEGFKAPTLFQLLSKYGNAALRPETARSFDIGLAHEAAGLALSATLFRRDSRDLIVFASCESAGRCLDRPFGLYENVARARAEGLELEAGAALPAGLRIDAAYAYVAARSRDRAGPDGQGADLPRRPRHMLSAALAWQHGPLSLGTDLRLVSASFDDAANLRRLDGHALVAVTASRQLGERLELFGRIENLFDTSYETVAGYGTWGRAAFLGIRAGL